jgi:hypothetical protein
MTLKQLQYITTVAETGNLTEAARRLFIAQPSLTAAIRSLEQEYHITVFSRSNKGMTLTAEGEEFLGYANQVLEQANLIDERYTGRPKGKQKFFVSSHDFEKDIISSAIEISRRYNGSRERSKTLEKIALTIFDSTSRMHGMGSRERLLLQIAAILHDCGKFISMNDLSECAYHIIMATEIIGLSGGEREIVANVVRFNHSRFVYYEEQTAIDRERYSVIARLTAILRAANGLDRSHNHKFSDFKIRMKGYQLSITVDVRKDITLEKGLFDKKADFFEEIFNIRPVIKQKKL